MKSIKVRDLMVPLAEYATVPGEATLYEAVVALENAQAQYDQSRYRHRAVLVFDRNRKIVGKLSQLDIITALEPKYGEISDSRFLSRTAFGFSQAFLKQMVRNYGLWDQPLNDICKKAYELKVSEFMYTPTDGEYVDEDASLNEAINQLVLGHHQSLLVTKENDIVGILRLTDVFKEICDTIKSCTI